MGLPGGGSESKLASITPKQLGEFLDLIKCGAMGWVAAKTIGIHRSTFWRWMKVDENAEGEEPYNTPAFDAFREAVWAAEGHARSMAEIDVRVKDPLSWLRMGPGRDRGKDAPGWTNTMEISGPDKGPLNVHVVNDAAANVERMLKAAEASAAQMMSGAGPPPEEATPEG
jgi:hypothetical protein